MLDGGDIRYRFAAALDLLRQGYAPRLLVSQTVYCTADYLTVDDISRVEPEKIHWVYHTASSSRQEAYETRGALKQLGCKKVLVVTTDYLTRRVRTLFRRALKRDGIAVSVYPVPVPFPDGEPWWKSHLGRSAILLQTAKLVLAWLNLDLPLPADMRVRLKEHVERAIP